ncbi:MAG: hypothetical protein WCW17_01950 [Patescibacteria group bacterium]
MTVSAALAQTDIPRSLEIRIGEEAITLLEKRFGPSVYQDITTCIGEVRSPLADNDPEALKSGIKYRVRVFKTPEVISFSLPGNIICFSLGLLRQGDSHLISYLLSRETYHCEIQSYYPKKYDFGSTFGKLGSRDEQIKSVAKEVADYVLSTKRNMTLEKQADYYGAIRMLKEGSDEKAYVVNSVEKLSVLSKTLSPLMTFMDSHQGTPISRLEIVQKAIADFHRNKDLFISDSDKEKLVKKAAWYRGILHLHTTFSDGSDNIPQRVLMAKSSGCQYAFISDHYNQINSVHKEPAERFHITNPRGLDKGFADYIRNCQEQTTSGFVAIPAAELSSPWNAEFDTEDSAHTLALGPIIQDEILDKLDGQKNSQSKVLSRIREVGMFPVAAHPRLISSFYGKAQKHFRYDLSTPRYYKGTRGIGFFNQSYKEDLDTLDWYCKLIQAALKEECDFPVAVSENDSHGLDKAIAVVSKDLAENLQLDDKERWTHITFAMTKGLSSKGILDAYEDGQTYATRGYACLTSMNQFPSGASQYAVEKPSFRFTLAFIRYKNGKPEPIKVPTEIKITMYRDGEIVKESIKKYKKGTSKCQYFWSEPKDITTRHAYFLFVDNFLVTSPFIFDPYNKPS